MFILDSLMISGIRWALETALTAAEAEMNDDSVLREQLLEAEMRREMGEISDDDFRAFEADLLARIREIKERREGGAGPLAFGPQPIEAGDGTFQVEASVFGDFHDPATAPHTTVLAPLDEHHALASLVSTTGEETIEVLDMEPGDAAEPQPRGSAARTPSRTRKGIASAAPGRCTHGSGTPPRSLSPWAGYDGGRGHLLNLLLRAASRNVHRARPLSLRARAGRREADPARPRGGARRPLRAANRCERRPDVRLLPGPRRAASVAR